MTQTPGVPKRNPKDPWRWEVHLTRHCVLLLALHLANGHMFFFYRSLSLLQLVCPSPSIIALGGKPLNKTTDSPLSCLPWHRLLPARCGEQFPVPAPAGTGHPPLDSPAISRCVCWPRNRLRTWRFPTADPPCWEGSDAVTAPFFHLPGLSDCVFGCFDCCGKISQFEVQHGAPSPMRWQGQRQWPCMLMLQCSQGTPANIYIRCKIIQ